MIEGVFMTTTSRGLAALRPQPSLPVRKRGTLASGDAGIGSYPPSREFEFRTPR